MTKRWRAVLLRVAAVGATAMLGVAAASTPEKTGMKIVWAVVWVAFGVYAFVRPAFRSAGVEENRRLP